jgi:hypothetical protein
VGFAAFVVLALVAAGGIWYFQFQLKQKRIANLRAVATQLGFEFSPDDRWNTFGFPFALFGQGDGQGVENVMVGERNGVPVRLFDFWYYDETSDTNHNRSRSYHRFTCAALTIDADCPTLRIGHESVLSRIGSALGFHDVELEYDDFNRRYRVKCKDQKFAFSLLDGRMMEWLLAASAIDSVEVVGPFLLLALPRLASEDWPGLLTTAEQFLEHVPRVVFSTWPRGRA